MALTSDSPLPLGVMFARIASPSPGRMSLPDVCCDLLWFGGRLHLLGPASVSAPPRAAGRACQLMNIDPLLARFWLGIPLWQITDDCILLEDISPGASSRLSELFEANCAEQLVRPPQSPHGFALDHRAASAGAVLRRGGTVSAAAQAACLSTRQLERLFADRFGLAPKQYASIVRLRWAVALAAQSGSIAAAAAEAGYVDQPHFTHEARRLTGLTPGALLPRVANSQYVIARTRDD
jgi:AraC-like DNA-binding protein